MTLTEDGSGEYINNKNQSAAERKKFLSAKKKTIALFDLDGTLTEPRQQITKHMLQKLQQLRNERGVPIAIVSGSDENKVCSQLHFSRADFCDFDYLFFENGCVAYRGNSLLHEDSLAVHLGEENLKEIINFSLFYIANLDIPIKRGTFVEYRHGLLNISPIGRNCSGEERSAFCILDENCKIRENMLESLRKRFSEKLQVDFVIGGQISIDCYPKGWDKRHCLQYLQDFEEIHFFGDKVEPGGNDYEIFTDERTVGHAVTGPHHTQRLLEELFL